MKKCLAKKFAQCEHMDTTIVVVHEEPKFEYDDSQLKQVLDEIFAVDPVSGFPKGDIQYFLSKDGNPQVKAWLESNLLQPRAVSRGTSVEGVTDDMIAEFSRKPGETNASYAARLASIRDEALANLNSQEK